MRRPPTWPELDRLARFVRAADSLTDTLATWTGRGLDVQIVRRVDRVFPDPAVAEILALHEGAWVQEREVRMRSAGLVVAEARSWVAVDSPALTPAVRLSLRSGGSLGDLLRPLQRRRMAVRIVVQAHGAHARSGHAGARGARPARCGRHAGGLVRGDRPRGGLRLGRPAAARHPATQRSAAPAPGPTVDSGLT